jgi:argininosuccinate synthase
VVAPIRDLSLTREVERRYAKEHGIFLKHENKWSIDENIWSRSIEEGGLENPSFSPPEEIFFWTTSTDKKKEEAEIVKITFEKGIPVSLNEEKMEGVSLIKKLNEIGGKHGVGRTDMMEDRVLGFKSREIYEHPAATILLEAHHDLERLILTRNELRFKEIVDRTWSELVYQGLIIDPLYESLNVFVDKTQERVSGMVDVKLEKGSARVVGRESPNALYSEDVSFDAKKGQRIAEGFSFYHGFQSRFFRRTGH